MNVGSNLGLGRNLLCYWELLNPILFFCFMSLILHSSSWSRDTRWNTPTLSEILLGIWTLWSWRKIIWEEKHLPQKFSCSSYAFKTYMMYGHPWPCSSCSIHIPAHFKLLSHLAMHQYLFCLCIEVQWTLLRFLANSQMATLQSWRLGNGKGSIFFR